jgi:acetyl/propionyl-CoA carboxylase alpha subunit
MHLATLEEDQPSFLQMNSRITVQDQIIDKIAKLDEVSHILRVLKGKFLNQEQISKDEVS